MIYLDNAATTLQKPPAVTCAAIKALRHMATPGRGGHPPAMCAAAAAFACREEAAELFDVPTPEQVVFTANATHALNLAIRSLVKPGSTVLISGYEHNAVTRPLYSMQEITVKIAHFPLFDQAAALEAFREGISEEVSVVIVTHVSNVFGFILPVEKIAQLCKEKDVPLIIDASQSAGCLPISLRESGAAFIAMPGHKGLYGPQGTGLLLCAHAVEPLLMGGTGSDSILQQMPVYLPDRLEAGTHNMPGISGLLEGIRFVRRTGLQRICAHEQRLLKKLGAGLRTISGAQVYQSLDPFAQTGALSFTICGLDCETLGERLAERGIAVRAGLHCAPLAHSSAGTLDSGTVRVSVSAFTTDENIQDFLREMPCVLY